MPLDVPSEFLNEDLIIELSQSLKEMQIDFKEVHKAVDLLRGSGTKPGELKAEITQLEQERTQLQAKIQRMKKDAKNEGSNFEEMLKVTSALRKEQEEEVRIHERLRDYKKGLQDAEGRLADTNRRLSEVRGSGAQTQTAEQLLTKLQKDVRELADRREGLETSIADREIHLEKLHSWDSSDRMTTEDDVRSKRDQVRDMEDQVSSLQESLEAALERNTKLVVFKQASTIALKKMRDKEDEVEKVTEEKRRIAKHTEDKENELRSQGKMGSKGGKMGKKDLEKYGATVMEKIVKYKKMKDELSLLRGELVILQRTEQILKSRDNNLDDFLQELERKKGIEGYRDTQKSLVEMAERSAEVDQMKGATLEQISDMVGEIGREFKSKQAQLNPLMAELKKVRQQYMDVESEYLTGKNTYDKVAVGLEMDKQALEKECDSFQDECLREESRFHLLTSQCNITRIKLERAEQEKKWLAGNGRLLRDFASFKDLYANKLTQQDQLTKQLRKKQKDLKENAGAMTNQKTNFSNLQALLQAKVRCEQGSSQSPRGGGSAGGGSNTMSLDY
mmetsp:Transcript_11256/g.10886  ORF Transcript_11256/g.10886 Transcript_11256/m.10886 type:complete len:562 (+) Transcript_11256:46-1731(+)